MGKEGTVTGLYTGNRRFTGRCDFAQGGSGLGIQVVKDSQIWYVDKNKTSPAASGDGLSWDQAFLTLTEAVAAAGRYDIIYVGRGYYQEAATITIESTQRGLKIIGPTSGGVSTSNGFSSATSGDHILIIDADDVEICGLSFWCVTNGKSGIIIGDDYDGYNNWIHDCTFITGTAGNTLGEYGIKVNNTDDCVGTLIENNYFHYLSTAAIVVHATRTTIRNNMIWTSAIGIDIQNTGASRACCAVTDNYIIGMATTETGIKLHATEADDGNVLVANNVVTNCNLNITQDKSDAGIVNNGTSGNGTGMLIVDAQAS